MTITDKYGLVHPEEEVRRVVARLVPKGSPAGKALLAQAGDPGQRAALGTQWVSEKVKPPESANVSPALAPRSAQRWAGVRGSASPRR